MPEEPIPAPETLAPTPMPTIATSGTATTAPIVVNVPPPSVVAFAPVGVAALALIFTVASFWWLQARRGRLLSYAPQSYAGVLDRGAILNIPLVLHNTGPTPIIVRDFQLRLAKESTAPTPLTGLPLVMSWTARQGQLEPAGELAGVAHGTRSMPAPFVVGPRAAEPTFIEFGTRREDVDLRAVGPLSVTVLVRAEGRGWWDRTRRRADTDGWSTLVIFDLHTQLEGGDGYITRTNDPDWDV